MVNGAVEKLKDKIFTLISNNEVGKNGFHLVYGLNSNKDKKVTVLFEDKVGLTYNELDGIHTHIVNSMASILNKIIINSYADSVEGGSKPSYKICITYRDGKG
nr:MAG TPA: hypothetical protein [Bacteriophage sp.]